MTTRPRPLARVKQTYTDEARRLASRSMGQLEQTSVTPNALSVAGVAETGNHLVAEALGMGPE